MIQVKQSQIEQNDTVELSVSDSQRIDLIANLLLDYLDEEGKSDEETLCRGTQIKMQ